MLRFLAFRILQAIPVLFVMSLVTFVIIQAPPGDYGDFVKSNMMSQGGASAAPPEAAAPEYPEREGLNDPLPIQYLRWIGGIVTRGDFGHSFFYNKPPADAAAARLPRPTLAAPPRPA